MPHRQTFVIGTRGSPLALAQAHETQARLAVALGWEKDRLPLRIIKTTGDMIQDRSLAESGGKGLFTKELDQALLAGEIDLAVHSSKDLPTAFPDAILVVGCLPREDVRDAFICHKAATLHDLPKGAIVGSASLRRQAQVKRLRPDLNVTLLRGNVQTRLDKLRAATVDATLLAMAGLTRLGYLEHVTQVLPVDDFLPAVGQGAIGLTARTGDERVREALMRIIDESTSIALRTERAYLAVLDGSCRMPIAGFASVANGRIAFRGQVLKPDGSDAKEVVGEGAASDAEAIGHEAGRDLKARLPAGFLD